MVDAGEPDAVAKNPLMSRRTESGDEEEVSDGGLLGDELLGDEQAAFSGVGEEDEAAALVVVAGGRADVEDDDDDEEEEEEEEATALRAVLGFWLMGVLNNASFVIMIAAAKSIDAGGVALVFIAATCPGMVVELTAPLWFERVSYEARVMAAAGLMLAAFALVGPLGGGALGRQLVGVALCSAQSALGQGSMLALATRFPQRGQIAVAAWSAGTGFAGVVGYAWVAILTLHLHLPMDKAIALAMALLPAAYLAAFRNLLHTKKDDAPTSRTDDPSSDPDAAPARRSRTTSSSGRRRSRRPGMTMHTVVVVAPRRLEDMGLWARVGFAWSLWPVTGAIFAVYFAEYAMQAGVWAAMGLPTPRKANRRIRFYEFSNWLYQCGVLVSRSSALVCDSKTNVDIRNLWALALGQCGLLVFFALDAAFHWWYDSSILALCFVVGLFGGAVYVHGFRILASTGDSATRELAMPIGAFAADAGVALSDVSGLFIQGCLYAANDIKGASVPIHRCKK